MKTKTRHCNLYFFLNRKGKSIIILSEQVGIFEQRREVLCTPVSQDVEYVRACVRVTNSKEGPRGTRSRGADDEGTFWTSSLSFICIGVVLVCGWLLCLLPAFVSQLLPCFHIKYTWMDCIQKCGQCLFICSTRVLFE